MNIVLCMATSLDGKINREGEDQPRFTSGYDRKKLFRWRAWADGLLVGAETVRHENLPPWIRNEEWIETRVAAGKKPHPDIYIASKSGKLPFMNTYFENQKQKITVLCDGSRPDDCPKHVNWQPIGANLLSNIKVNNLLIEGGARLAYSLIESQIPHRLALTIAPEILGGITNPSLVVGPSLSTFSGYKIDQLHCHLSEIHAEYVYDPGMHS